MIKIGITGSIASGKTTASKILSHKRGPLFNADKEVERLYKNKKTISKLRKKLNIDTKQNFKSTLKKKILNNKKNIKKLEKIIHPIIRREMKKFSFLHNKKKIIFFEIPLLIESKLMNYFDVIIFIKSKKKLRLKRFKANGGDIKLFNLLNGKQFTDQIKAKFCDHTVVNEKNLNILKKKLLSIIKLYV